MGSMAILGKYEWLKNILFNVKIGHYIKGKKITWVNS